MSTLVIYHDSCVDGFCSAWLLHHAYPSAEFHAAQYGTKPPDVVGKRVYVVDFSYPRDVMSQIIGQAHSVCVLDHHATAQEDLEGLPSCTAAEFENLYGCLHITFDMGKSGARLTWEHLWDTGLIRGAFHEGRGYSRDVVPWLVDFSEDRDLWRHELPHSREVNAALRSHPMTFGEWDRIYLRAMPDDGWVDLVNEGRAILRDQKRTIDSHVSHAREITFDGHRVLCVNATTLISEIAGELAKGRAFGLCWFQRQDGRYVYSLRSREGGVDVAEIARRHGGGGHKAAAGFEADQSLDGGGTR